MTQQEAHALVRAECRKRGRKYGANNKAAIRAMREEIEYLRLHPRAGKLTYCYHFIVMRSHLNTADGSYRLPVRAG